MRRSSCWTALVSLTLVTSAASAQTNTFSSGTLYNSPGLTGFTTSGALMSGMQVTWTLLGGGGGTAAWGELADPTYGVSFGGFEVSFSREDTFVDNTGAPTYDDRFWSVFNNTGSTLASITFNGAPGYTVFDCGWNVDSACNPTWVGAFTGTVGSARGVSHTSFGGTYTGPVFGYYTNQVGIAGAAPVGDIFEQFSIVFGTSGMADGLSYRFFADTDNSDFRFDPPAPVSAVPEPATMTLLATGLAGLLATRRRKAPKP